MLEAESPMSAKDWKEVALSLNFNDIPHSWFIIRETYLRMTKPIKRKRKLLKVQEVPFPCLPSVNEVNQLLSSMIVESVDINPLTSPKEYDAKVAEILREGKIYIGKEDNRHLTTVARRRGGQSTTTVIADKVVPVRVKELRFIMVKLAQKIVDSQCLRDADRTKPITVKVKSHMDGTTSLKWPLFTVNFALVHDPQLFDLEAISFADLTALETHTAGILKETCLAVKDRASLLGQQLLTIVEPINYGGLQFKFQYALETGDWSLLQKSTGNKSGGHHRCILCGLDFAGSNSAQFLCYSHIISQVPKSIATSLSIFSSSNPDAATWKENLGLKEINSLFTAISAEERNTLLSTVMKDLKEVIDNLHTVKGHLARIVELERDRKDFNDTLFLSNLNLILGRLSTAGTDMNGQSFRKLAILFEEILLPAVARDRKEAFASLYHNWSEIQFLMYDYCELATSDKSILDGIKTRMHLCTFLHLHQAKELYGKNVHDLYFHVIVAHVAIAFEADGNFRNGSVERGESQLAIFKRIMKDYTNRHMGSALKELMIRIQMEKQVENLLHFADDKDCELSELFCNSHEWGEIVIDKKFVAANESEWKSLLFVMGSFRETKYVEDERGYTFTTVESINKLCEIQNKQFKRSVTDKILPVSFSSSLVDCDEDEIGGDIVDEELLEYIKLSKELKSLEEARHMDKIHLHMYQTNWKDLTNFSDEFEKDPERLSRIKSLIKHVEDSQKLVRTNSQATVEKINATHEKIDKLKAQSEAVKVYVGKVTSNNQDRATGVVIRNNADKNDEDHRETSDSDFEEERQNENAMGEESISTNEENSDSEEYDEERDKQFYENAKCGPFDPSIVIGSRIQVYWKGNKTWYRGRIVEWSEKVQKYLIDYDEEEDLAPMGENLTGDYAEKWDYVNVQTRRNPTKSAKGRELADLEWE